MTSLTHASRAGRSGTTGLSERAIRSRNKLKAATRKLLNQRGPEKLQVQEIARRAGVAHGLFYRYFKDAEDILLEVAQDFMTELNDDTKSIPTGDDYYELFYKYHLLAVKRLSQNPGLTRCLFQLTNKHPQLDRIWKQGVHEWNLRIAVLLHRDVELPRPAAELLAFSLGAMTEGVLFQYLIRHTEDLEHVGPNAQDIAEIIAVLWHRIVFLRDPSLDRLRVMKAVVASARRPTNVKGSQRSTS